MNDQFSSSVNDKPSPSVLPVFPEGKEPPRRRRTPWWKRALRSSVDSWYGLLGVFGFFQDHGPRRRPWWQRVSQFFLNGWTRFVVAITDMFGI